jgi:hypothetical protein
MFWQSRNSFRYCSRSALARFEYRPCFVFACRMRSIPSAVFGPVLSPPWSTLFRDAFDSEWHLRVAECDPS